MDETRSTDERRARLILNAGLACVAAATGAAFGRLFAGAEVAWSLGVAGVAAVLLAAVLERRNIFLSLMASAAGCLVVLGLFVFANTTFAGLPLPGTVRAIAAALGEVGRHAAQEFTPAAPLPSLISASMIAVWTASYAMHALSARAGSSIIALVPPAGLLAFAAVLAEDGPRPGYAATFLAGALAALHGSGLRRLRDWGPLLVRARGLGATSRHARGLAGLALSIAVLAPGILPGLRGEAAVDVRERGSGQLGVSPIVDIRPVLLSDPGVELFRVRAARPAYWRLTALDRFDGRRWTSANLHARNGTDVAGRAALPGSRRAAGSGRLVQEFEISGLDAEWLPVAFQPQSVALPGGKARFDEHLVALVPTGDLSEGFTYGAVSELVVPSSQDLHRVPDFGDDRRLGVQTSLPDTVPRRVTALARRIAGDAPNQYRRVLAIQDHLRSVTYDLQAPAGHGVDDILYFLEESRRGYCEQFAATMAVLLRALGYGARVAIGFTPGDPLPDGSFRVTTKHVHAWTEVFFRGYGWLPFEPTPSRQNPVAVDYAHPPTAILDPGSVSPPDAISASQTRQEIMSRAAQREAVEADDVIPEGPLPESPERGGRRIPMGLSLLAAAVTLVGMMIAARLGRRRSRIRRAQSSRERVLSSYRYFAETAADLGLGRMRSETPWEHARRLRTKVPLTDGHLERLTWLTAGAAYGRNDLQRRAGVEASEASRALGRDLRRHAGALRSLLGALGIRVSPPREAGGPPGAAPGRTGLDRSGTR